MRPSTSFHFTHFAQGTHSAAAKLNETFPYDSSGIIYNKPIKSHEICDPYWGRTSSWGLLIQHH
ncbi:MAG: hypothetical protein K9I25_00505, partial [Crocinitomicaceae bacterium]|nr:hypothetical protein [Crocinitomicaceae bacterium]